MSEKGKFVSIHGIDGTGKTTTAEKVQKAWQERGLPAINYDLYKNGESNPYSKKKDEADVSGTLEERLVAYLESTMYHSEKIQELVQQGYHVVKSRYLDDVMAHFAHLGVSGEEIHELTQRFPIVQPDLKIILTVDEPIRRERIGIRGELDERDKEHKVDGSRLLFFEDFLKKNASKNAADTLHIDVSTIDSDAVAKKIVERLTTSGKPMRKNGTKAFNTKAYLEKQQQAFQEALTRDPEKPVFIEFGGKPFSDHHAERVLPGYDAECKAEILRETVKVAEVVMVVNALDILRRPDGRTLRGRMRGDTNLFYDNETLRLLQDAHNRNIPIQKVVMSVTPSSMSSDNQKRVDRFRESLKLMDVSLLLHNKIENYPDTSIFESEKNPFDSNDTVITPGKNLVVVSPGGGSGKFSVLLSEMYNALLHGEVPDYVKFETFPIYQLDAAHALNLAFEAATVDLKNKVINIDPRDGQTRTSYDKDLQNYELLVKMFAIMGQTDQVAHLQDAVDMGINQIVHGINDMDKIVKASHKEVMARILRYEAEVATGIESLETVRAAKDILGKFEMVYQIKTRPPISSKKASEKRPVIAKQIRTPRVTKKDPKQKREG